MVMLDQVRHRDPAIEKAILSRFGGNGAHAPGQIGQDEPPCRHGFGLLLGRLVVGRCG